jgi:hypothetical protein
LTNGDCWGERGSERMVGKQEVIQKRGSRRLIAMSSNRTSGLLEIYQ